MRNVLLLLAVSTVLFGCTVSTTYPSAPQVPAAVQPQAETAGSEREDPSLTISEAIQICKEIHTSPELGIGCDVHYVEGRLAMAVVFQDNDAMRALWTSMSEYVAAPFCFAAVAANREAFVFLGVKDTKQARHFSCEMQEWSEWFDYGSTGAKRY